MLPFLRKICLSRNCSSVEGGLIFMGAIGDHTPFLPGDAGMGSVVSPPLPSLVGQESKRLGELFATRKVFLLD